MTRSPSTQEGVVTDFLDLDAFWLERPDLRPPEDLVLKAMAQMGIADEPQTDLFGEPA